MNDCRNPNDKCGKWWPSGALVFCGIGAALFARQLFGSDALTNIDPSVFRNWEVMDFSAKASTPLAKARSHIGTMIENRVVRGESGEPELHHVTRRSAPQLLHQSLQEKRLDIRRSTLKL